MKYEPTFDMVIDDVLRGVVEVLLRLAEVPINDVLVRGLEEGHGVDVPVQGVHLLPLVHRKLREQKKL